MNIELYTYKAKCTSVVDGDTIKVVIDLGFSLTIKQTVRFNRINAPELKEKDLGLSSKQFLENLLLGKDIYVKTAKSSDKYGRYLAEVFLEELNINDHMVKEGYAKNY